MSQKQFDIVRACFYLVAFVIGAHVLAAILGELACLYYAEAIIEGKFKCDMDGKLSEILAAALAAALAFAGGRALPPSRGDRDE